ncbi:hypothetical protein EW026_g509 [Hermanssonia centrifuga]|uniref:BHLH domain-containing protein n=1 Tax=Hermanssonia centrifuga TaxID=98765 RepID=A0A4V6S127_9APHY|nr:hypothetical protein EW026_g509 [Hermanssonia centrifuga]
MEVHVLDHSKDFMDTSSTYFDHTLSGLEYLQYPSDSFEMGLQTSSSPRIGGFNSLNLNNGGMSSYTYGPSTSSYSTGTPARPYTPTGSIYPGALSGLADGELSSDSVGSNRSRRGSGAISPPPGSLAAVPRSHRFNPLATAVTRTSPRQAKKRSKGSDDFDSDNDDDFNPSTSMASNDVRREEIRRQRIESEQRRRDELRDGYRRLKDALPVSNQKSSKVSLLDRATTHIRYLEVTQQQLQTRLAQAEAETARLRHVNEALMLGTAEQRHAAAASAVAAATASQTPASAF